MVHVHNGIVFSLQKEENYDKEEPGGYYAKWNKVSQKDRYWWFHWYVIYSSQIYTEWGKSRFIVVYMKNNTIINK